MILVKLCRWHVAFHQEGTVADDVRNDVELAEIDDSSAKNIARTSISTPVRPCVPLRCAIRIFHLGHRQAPKSLQSTKCVFLHCHSDITDELQVSYDDVAKDLTLIGIVAIEDSLRDGTLEAVEDCHKAGIAVKMCTGDNVLTACSTAMQCGIFKAGGIIMEGPFFRQLDNAQMLSDPGDELNHFLMFERKMILALDVVLITDFTDELFAFGNAPGA